MAVTWNWSDKVGSCVAIDRNGKEYEMSLYSGNCLLIFIYEIDEKQYQFMNFWNDETHMKNCLGLTKGHTENIHMDIVKWTFNHDFEDLNKIVRSLIKARWASFTLEVI